MRSQIAGRARRSALLHAGYPHQVGTAWN
eukprot:SAG22_NODE_16859_length_316_cov_0.732719_2_plen_28_part_01